MVSTQEDIIHIEIHSGVENRKIMKVSTLAYSSDLMFVKIVAQKMRATGKKARVYRTLVHLSVR